MEEDHQLKQTQCLNCNATAMGDFCHQCGQSVRDNLDRSLGKLMGEFFGNIFFLDNRFFLSLRYLTLMPGRLTVEFLAGKRKKFISPITLFLFINLIYFFVNPLTDYSLALNDQIYSQPYSPWIKGWVSNKLQAQGLTFHDYGIAYQNMSDNIAKSIMIINIPMIAAIIYLISFKRRRYYYDSLIFAFHFFSFFMASWILSDWIDTLITFIVWAIPAGIVTLFSVFFSNMIYRFIIFVLTFWFT